MFDFFSPVSEEGVQVEEESYFMLQVFPEGGAYQQADVESGSICLFALIRRTVSNQLPAVVYTVSVTRSKLSGCNEPTHNTT